MVAGDNEQILSAFADDEAVRKVLHENAPQGARDSLRPAEPRANITERFIHGHGAGWIRLVLG